MLAVQYLEPDVVALTNPAVRAQLRAAFERLPISAGIVGWDLPESLRRACVEETARAGARLCGALVNASIPALFDEQVRFLGRAAGVGWARERRDWRNTR